MPTLGADQTGNADTVLQNIAGQTLAVAPIVASGQVTSSQQKQLDALEKSGSSALTQYYTGLGLSAASFRPDALVKSGILATRAQWSQMDTGEALNSLNLASQDYNQYIKDQLASSEITQKELLSAVAIAATIFTAGIASPLTAGVIAGGVSAVGGQSESQPGEQIA